MKNLSLKPIILRNLPSFQYYYYYYYFISCGGGSSRRSGIHNITNV